MRRCLVCARSENGNAGKALDLSYATVLLHGLLTLSPTEPLLALEAALGQTLPAKPGGGSGDAKRERSGSTSATPVGFRGGDLYLFLRGMLSVTLVCGPSTDALAVVLAHQAQRIGAQHSCKVTPRTFPSFISVLSWAHGCSCRSWSPRWRSLRCMRANCPALCNWIAFATASTPSEQDSRR